MLFQIPENPNPKSGIVPGSCSFEDVLSSVSDFKAPVFEPGGSMQQGMYTPKGKGIQMKKVCEQENTCGIVTFIDATKGSGTTSTKYVVSTKKN